MRQVEIAGIALDAASGTPMVLLRENDAPHRVVPIVIGGPEAAAIGLALAGVTSPRPLTYDLMATLMDSLDARLDRIEVTAMRDGAFLAEMQLTGPSGDQRLDSRPSDAIALALRMNAPMYASEDVLDEAGAVLQDEEPLDDDTIDDEVEAFSDFLADITPGDFGSTSDD